MSARERYDEIAAELAARSAEVELGQMMGMPAIKAGGKMIGGFFEDEMVFKLLDAAVRERALALDGAKLFDPRGGRPMKEWVQVPSAHADDWPELAAHAVQLRSA